jgi:hypothetical protein
VEPVDARGYRGVRFDVRGDGGAYGFTVNTLSGRWRKTVTATDKWTTVEVPFAELERAAGRGGGEGAWSGADLVDVGFSGGRKAGQKLWLEVDNVTFY